MAAKKTGDGIYFRPSKKQPANKKRLVGSWWIDTRIGGKRYIRRLGKGITRQSAEELATVFRSKVLRGESGIGAPKDITFDKAVEIFLEHSAANCSQHTVDDYRQSVRQLEKTFAGKRLSQITIFALEGHKRARIKQGAKVRVNRELQAARRIFNISKAQKRFGGESPFPAVKLLKEPKQKVRFLDDEEEERLLAACDPQLRTVCILGIYCGLRIQREALTLRWGAVDMAPGLLTVESAYAKSGKSRTIPMNSIVRESVQEHRRQAKDTSSGAHVFLNRRGEPYARRSGIRKAFDTACDRAKIHGATPHIGRHTFASRLVMAGVDLRTVQELGGWASLAMVERYAHLAPEHKFEAVERLAKKGSASRRYADIAKVGSS